MVCWDRLQEVHPIIGTAYSGFWWGPPPRFKEIFKVSVEGLLLVQPHATMGSGLVKYIEGNPYMAPPSERGLRIIVAGGPQYV